MKRPRVEPRVIHSIYDFKELAPMQIIEAKLVAINISEK
jgi:hypothetical protein